ncbi:MAG: VanW family protein, partial [Pseudonocardiales bacterium]|nr:VanW family protein [Pseudonocardiales bacterium]
GAAAAATGGAEAPTRPTARPDAPADTTRPGGDEATAVVARPSDAETTQVIPVSKAPAPASASAEPPTEQLRAVPAARPPVPPAGDGPTDGEGGGRRRRLPLLVTAAVVLALGLLYVGDLVLTSGSVPRGTTVAGVDVGGLSLADAEQRLRAAVEPRSTQPVPVTAGDVTSEIDPVAAGLTVDWEGTLAQAGDQPLNPITRIASFFTTSNVLGVVTTADDQALTTAVEQLGPVVDTEPVEGTVRFEGVTPVPVDPVPGQQLDPPAAVEAIKANWASGEPVVLPLISLPALTTPEDVAGALEDVAAPAVSGPVTVIGEQNTQGVLEPEVIAQALSFEPGEAGGLNPVLNPTVVTDALEEQLAGSEQEARDAELDFSTNPATVIPSQDGRGVDYEATLADLLPVLTGSGPREITAVYADQPADLTTDELNGLGDAGVISSFTTRGFAQDSGVNIRRAAELVNGTIVGPGETFSLDAVTGPRTAANGYIEAGVIDNGRAGRGIAGGVSQVSTTTYNAAYFAGMTDVEHRAHSFYISRYPEGREATIVTGALDMRFRNDTPTAVLIRTVWTPSDITVTFYGTKYYDVTSSTSPRRDFTQPNTVNVPAGEPCTPSQGAQGFTVTDTRTLRNLQTGEVTTESQTTRYNPAPIVVCGG